MQTIGCKVLFKCTDKDYHCGDQDFDQLEVGVAGAASDAVLVHRRAVAVALQHVFFLLILKFIFVIVTSMMLTITVSERMFWGEQV